MLGLLRTVLFAPEDLALVKGDPAERRRFLDDLLVLRTPRFAGVRADYDRVLKQRNALLKTAGVARRRGGRAESTCARSTSGTPTSPGRAPSCWPRRLELVDALRPLVDKAYDAVAGGAAGADATIDYQPSLRAADLGRDRWRHRATARCSRDALLAERRAPPRASELERGVSPRRPAPRRPGPRRSGRCRPRATPATASPGRSRWRCGWRPTTCCAPTGDDPVLILDDVFAELDTERRERLAELVAGAEQVLVTAAVARRRAGGAGAAPGRRGGRRGAAGVR